MCMYLFPEFKLNSVKGAVSNFWETLDIWIHPDNTQRYSGCLFIIAETKQINDSH